MYFGATRATGATRIHTYIYGETYTPYTFAYKTKCENSVPSCPNTTQRLSYQSLQLGQLAKYKWPIGQLELSRRPIC
jgi:hypothetical protein